MLCDIHRNKGEPQILFAPRGVIVRNVERGANALCTLHGADSLEELCQIVPIGFDPEGDRTLLEFLEDQILEQAA